jgi:pimeloyl-ACP methyl ester carboxylesterase
MKLQIRPLILLFVLTTIGIGCSDNKHGNKNSGNKEIAKETGAQVTSDEIKTDAVLSGDVTIFFHEKGEGEPIVLLPGGSLDSYYLIPLADSLVQKGYRVIRIDPRGTGKSTGPASPVTMHDLGKDVNLVLEKLDLKSVSIAGHAFGNRVARVVANDYPEKIKNIILLSAGGVVEPKDEALKALQTLFTPTSTNEEIQQSMTYFVGDKSYIGYCWNYLKKSRSPKAAGIQSLAMQSTPISDWSAPKGNSGN